MLRLCSFLIAAYTWLPWCAKAFAIALVESDRDEYIFPNAIIFKCRDKRLYFLSGTTVENKIKSYYDKAIKNNPSGKYLVVVYLLEGRYFDIYKLIKENNKILELMKDINQCLLLRYATV